MPALAALALARPARADDVHLSVGTVEPGHQIVVRAPTGVVTLCAPACALAVPRGTVEIGLERRGADVAWSTLEAPEDLRLDVVLEDRGPLRSAGHALLIAGAVLSLSAGLVGIATAPTPPEVGWFGARHGLVFAAISGGLALAFGAPGAGLAIGFAHDAPALRAVPAS